MPDADIAPVIIGDDLLAHLKSTLGVLPDDELNLLTTKYGLTMKDAMSLVALNDGYRAEYFYDVVDALSETGLHDSDLAKLGRVCGNWVLHELGGVVVNPDEGVSVDEAQNPLMDENGQCIVPATTMARIIYHLEQRTITGKTAKSLLSQFALSETPNPATPSPNSTPEDVDSFITQNNLWLQAMSTEEYDALAREVIEAEPEAVKRILKGQDGKVMFLVGQMMRKGEEGRVEPKVAAEAVKRVVEEFR
jgi:aspartyl-tRNA(Asn)/glutamyl-tRNA(Gln) amidotransferase subunit B